MKKICVALLLAFCACAFGCVKTPTRNEALPLLTTNYAIQAELLPTEHRLNVTTVIGYSVPADELWEIKLRIYANAYREGKVVPEDKRTDAYPRGVESYGNATLSEISCDVAIQESAESADGTTLTLLFARALERGERVTITLKEQITLANVKHRLGYYDGTYYLSDFYPMVCPYQNGTYQTPPYAERGDPFCFEKANFTLSLTLPKSYECAACAKEEDRDYQGTFACFTYSLQGARDLALVASETLRFYEGEAAGIPYRLYCSNAKEKAKIMAWTEEALCFFSQEFGAYPYPTFTLVLAPFFEAGVEHSGMGLVSCALSLADTKRALLHEIAHQWWFGKVGNDQFTDPWMDEGLAEYSVACFYKQQGKEGVYREMAMQAEDAYSIRLALKGSEGIRFDKTLTELSEGYYDRVYCGGLLLFCTLAEKFGFHAFNAALNRYAQSYDGKIAAPQDLITALSQNLHKDLFGIFDAWLGGTVPVE